MRPLSTSSAWNRLLARLKREDWPDGVDHTAGLRALARTARRRDRRRRPKIGDAFLKGRALAIWRKALLAGPAASIDATLETLKQDDGLDACVSVAWMPASALAASPRRFVRLIGLNSSRWPRGIAEDRLIPDHIIPTAELDPLPVSLADRRDFETILATTSSEVVLSRARRDSDGRLLGRSPLLAGHGEETYLRRNAVPEHAFSETDRLMARPQEFGGRSASDQRARLAGATGSAQRSRRMTVSSGPIIRSFSRSSRERSRQVRCRRLLRSPLGFVWRYAFGWRAPESSAEPWCSTRSESATWFTWCSTAPCAIWRARADWCPPTPRRSRPRWTEPRCLSRPIGRANARSRRRSSGDARWTMPELLAGRALTYGDEPLPDARSYGEVPFGGSEPKSEAETPWDRKRRRSRFRDTGFNIAGYIDRLDISGDGKRALVRDYKTGRPPRGEIRLNGGRELQRCLYAFAVKALLGDDVAISASLLYPREPIDLQLDDPEAALAEITDYLRAARTSLAGGAALPGPDTGGDYDDLAFALPANAGATYCKRKHAGRDRTARRSHSGLGGGIMSSVSKALKDDGARRDAISLHDRSILVEAGAGSGKTAVMAGRIAVMLAEGVPPRAIAAVTFTELAASELLSRVRDFVADLSAGTYRARAARGAAQWPVAGAARQSRHRKRRDRRNHLLDHPRLLPAPDQALSGRGRYRSRRHRHGSQSGRSHLPRDRRRLAARAPLRRPGRHPRRNGAAEPR